MIGSLACGSLRLLTVLPVRWEDSLCACSLGLTSSHNGHEILVLDGWNRVLGSGGGG